MKLRQVALAAQSLSPYRQEMFDLLGLNADFKDPGVAEFGLENSVMAIGDSFLEIVAPTQDNTAAGRTLERTGTTACGYMVLFQVEDFAAWQTRLGPNIRRVWEIERAEVSACHIHPKDIGAAIVSVDEMRPPAEWVWGGPDWKNQQATRVNALVGCEVAGVDPLGLCQSWSQILGVQVDEDQSKLTFSDGTFVQFTPLGEGNQGVRSIVVSTEDPALLDQGSVTFGSFEIKFCPT